ncbi:MAG TPA: zf-HC2 domain-containing protein, partial [Thermoanaerobaculia bacterium]|nr:zf-HC2 domain-containing protein [Thermoanaerobaculia bacterium]
MDAETGRRLRHQEVWELLPWYVNGTLAAAERQAVDEHLERCPLCQSEVTASRRLSQAVRLAVEMPPSDERVARLLARLAPAPAAATPPPSRGGARLPAAVRWVITLQAAA